MGGVTLTKTCYSEISTSTARTTSKEKMITEKSTRNYLSTEKHSTDLPMAQTDMSSTTDILLQTTVSSKY